MELAHSAEGIYEDSPVWSLEWLEASGLLGTMHRAGTEGYRVTSHAQSNRTCRDQEAS
jgi:hypothetical protein